MRTNYLEKIKIMMCVLWISAGSVEAQEDTARILDNAMECLELQMEDMDGLGESEFVVEDLLERMDEGQGHRRPNLNDLGYEVAVSQLAMSDFQYYQLQLYIEKYGQLYSVYEIAAIDGFSEADMRRLAVLAEITPPPEPRPAFRQLIRSGKSVFWVRYGQTVERQSGYDTLRENHYDGSPAHVQFRYDYSISPHFGFKVAGEKDAGEAFFLGKQKYGFDHYSGAVYLRNVRWMKRLVIGDHRLNFGQGLVLGSSMMSGKGAGVSAARRFSDGVRPVATTSESRLLRGMAFTLGNACWEGSGFVGRVTGSSLVAFGGALAFRGKSLSVGVQAIGYGDHADSARFRERCSALFHPNSLNVGVSYQYVYRRQLLFGEAAVDGKGKAALLQGVILPVAPVFHLAALLRYYGTGYHSPMGNGFRTSSGDCGEFGTYLTGHVVVSRNLEADVFCDYYRLMWLSYLTDAPVQGMDAGFSLTCRLPRRNSLYVRCRWKTKPKNESENAYLHRLVEQSRCNFKIQWKMSPLSLLETKTEIAMAFNREPDLSRWRKGLLMYQDLSLNLPKPQLSFHFRIAYFDTDSYDERLYAYENDVYYAFTMGSYYYQGLRAYLLLRYKIRNFSVWFRVSRTHYLNKTEISSGLTQIDKPHKTEVKVQCMVRW